MGIQGFFNYFMNESNLQKHSNKFIIEEIIDDTVSRLYIDFVNIVHDVLAENKNLDNGKDESDILIIGKVIEKLQKIFKHYPKSKKLIFFECIPTVAKIKEQYARRIYRKIQMDIENNLKKILKCDVSGKFDHQKFAIDSSFIKLLGDSIEGHFSAIDDIQIFKMNNETLVGEAEHLIIQHIKNTSFNSDDKFVIYSPDADVFLLSTIITNLMDSEKKHITINAMRRSDDIVNRLYYRIDTNKYTEYLMRKINNNKKNKTRMINDITYIFNLLGDDFIPVFDKFKMSGARDVFPIIFKALRMLNDDEYILESSGTSNKTKHINKSSLLKIFEYINTVSIERFDIRPYKYIVSIPDGMHIAYNKLVYDVLQDAFQKGYYFYEKKNKSNIHKFGITDTNYNKEFDKVSSKFLIYETNSKTDEYIIKINNEEYKSVSLIEIDNKKTMHENDENEDNMIENYFEGYEFILDLYYNECGNVKNNYWYYKFEKSPKINKIIKWLKQNKLPTYNSNKIPMTYFNIFQYKKYLSEQLDTNYIRLLKAGQQNIRYDDLLKIVKKKVKNLIFNCYEKKYVNKCEIKGEIFLSPFDFTNGDKNMAGGFHSDYYMNKYFKYITKCSLLNNMFV
jgi:hypothetical protein